MSKFKELSSLPVAEREKQISDKWEQIDILKKSIDNRDGKENFVFYEGPPTANGRPGIHHVISRTLKDSVCKYKTMSGYRVLRKAGWDTHGLPVEIEVEKALNLSSKTEIENYGLDKFNKKCKESVFTYEAQWREMTKRMGYFVDMEDPYITLDNNYIETVWWILKQFFDAGMIYEGHKILPYCPRCGTGLASHEVAQGYQEIKSNTVVVPMKLREQDAYFLVWTTTPWTLASNVALAVNPKAVYVKASYEGKTYILAKELLGKVIGEGFEILEEMPGAELEYTEYEQLMPFLSTDKKAFYVTCADFVTTDDGTGVVHMAPAFGEDDYQVGRKYGLPVFNPVDEEGKYTDTPWEGMFVMDADIEIIKWLKENDKLFKKEKVAHNYPHCWRCKTPLIYYAKPSWYIEMTKIKDELIKNNNTVSWYPDYVGEKRFGNWLENLNDWAISRSRYWGTPLNIWKCECGHLESVGSRQELKDRAIEDISEDIELHRPYVDEVHIPCPKCEKSMNRVTEVIDCWFDSGSMPFAQYHYPFENKELFEEQFPADFICEGIDQTRGWFYSLIAISSFIMKKAPYKRVLVNDLILDSEGRKMSKTRGNTVDPFEMFDKFGADALRWYLLYVSPSWTPTKFDIEGLKEVQSKFFNTLKNVYAFFALYANTDDIDPNDFFIEHDKRPEIDRWVISKYNNLLKDVEEEMEIFDLTRVARKVQEFVNEDLSNWYIRRNRRRFWAKELTDDKKAVFNTTYEVLTGLAKLIAPFAPYIAEELYTKLTGEESVHLSDYPRCDESRLDLMVEERMDTVRTLVSLGRGAREEAQIKVRQPLKQILVDGKFKDSISYLVPLIKEELNIKEVSFEDNLNEFLDFSLKPDFKVAGPVFGPKVKSLAKALAQANAQEIVSTVKSQGSVTLSVDGEDILIKEEYLDVRISAKEGFNVQMENNIFVILDTALDEKLIAEGCAREIISKVQQMRKQNGYEVLDQIVLYINGDEKIQKAVESFKDFIKSETLTAELVLTDDELAVQSINGHETGIKVEKK